MFITAEQTYNLHKLVALFKNAFFLSKNVFFMIREYFTTNYDQNHFQIFTFTDAYRLCET